MKRVIDLKILDIIQKIIKIFNDYLWFYGWLASFEYKTLKKLIENLIEGIKMDCWRNNLGALQKDKIWISCTLRSKICFSERLRFDITSLQL